MSYILTEVTGFVATITINRPEALNALNRDVLEELDLVIARLAAEPIRCVVVTGAGDKAFVAGADIAAMAGMTRAEAEEFARLGQSVFRHLETLPFPVIAAVNGFALGGGCELALACDIRLASTKAVFGQPETELGIMAGFGGSQRLARLLGPSRAKELLYTAVRVNAHEAEVMGLVNAVIEPEDLLPGAVGLATHIAAQSPLGVRSTKRAIDRGLELTLDEGLALEAGLFAACFETADQRAAMTAFTERRPTPQFEDR